MRSSIYHRSWENLVFSWLSNTHAVFSATTSLFQSGPNATIVGWQKLTFNALIILRYQLGLAVLLTWIILILLTDINRRGQSNHRCQKLSGHDSVLLMTWFSFTVRPRGGIRRWEIRCPCTTIIVFGYYWLLLNEVVKLREQWFSIKSEWQLGQYIS